MFSTALKIHPSSRLYQKMPLLQHIVALSVVSAIRTISGYEVRCLLQEWENHMRGARERKGKREEGTE